MQIVTMINEDKIILLILKIFTKIVTIVEIIMKKFTKNNKENIIMEIVLMNDDAIIPIRASKGSAGLDLYSSVDVDIEVGSINKINTGICISLPENSYGSIRDKSSLSIKILKNKISYYFVKI